MLSLVVPAKGATIVLSWLRNALTIDDFPTFGLPTTDILGRPVTSSGFSSSNSAATASINSPVPLPLSDETQNNSSKPKE